MASLESLPYFKWYWRDWRSNRRVQRMHYIARGFYRELLDEQWSEGSLPNDLDEIADICGCPIAVMQEYWPEIEPCFVETEDGRLLNEKMENQRTENDAKRVKQADAGRKGGKNKLLNIKAKIANVQQSLPLPEQSTYSRAEHKQEQKQEQSRDTSNPPSLTSDFEGSLVPMGNPVRDAVERLFGFYCITFGRNENQYALTPQRREKAEMRMRERLRVHLGDVVKAETDCATAIENLSGSDWHRTGGYIDWVANIFKSQEEFEKRMNWKSTNGGNGNGNGNSNRGQQRTNSQLDALRRADAADNEREDPPQASSSRSSQERAGVRLGTGRVLEGAG